MNSILKCYDSNIKVNLVVGNKIILSFKDITIYNRSINFPSSKREL